MWVDAANVRSWSWRGAKARPILFVEYLQALCYASRVLANLFPPRMRLNTPKAKGSVDGSSSSSRSVRPLPPRRHRGAISIRP